MISQSTDQRSIEWYRARFGHITGSEVHKLMSIPRKKDELFTDTARSYLYQIAAERTFNPDFLADDDIFRDYLDQTSFVTRAMQWGIDQEAAARRLYSELQGGVEVFEVSSCPHDAIQGFAASPDGIVRLPEQRCLEIKCPTLATHMRYVAEIHDAASLKRVKPEYYWQVQAEMDCTGLSSADFVSYCAWLSRPIHIVNIPRSPDDIALLEERVRLADGFISNIINQ